MSNQISRRDILKGSAAAALGLTVVTSQAQQGKKTNSDYIRFGIIGVGGKGWSGMDAASKEGVIVGMCDIDATNRAKGLTEHPRASTFGDYRIMLETMHKQLDAVVISTPDHTHGPATALAMKYGLHCYTEKPMTRTVWEARQLAKTARDKKIKTQMGNQSTSNASLRKMAALIKKGTFGKVKAVHCWTDRASGWWPQGVPRPEAGTAPKHVDFDLWLGSSPARPYAPGYHPFAWRGWWDFGCGSLGDIGCHCMNLPFMALDLRDPIAIRAETSGHNKDSFPAWSIVHYEFGERNGRPAVPLTWYDGGKKPEQSLAPGMEFRGNGLIIVCDNATIFCQNEYGMDCVLVGGAPVPEIEVVSPLSHMNSFAEAVRGNGQATSNFPDYSGPLTEMVVLGNLAVWAADEVGMGPRLEWDARNMKVKGTSEYDVLIKPAIRDGFNFF